MSTALNLTLTTCAIDVGLHYPTPAGVDPATYTHSLQFCHNLQAGHCCQNRHYGGRSFARFVNYRVAIFHGLEALDIAAVWQANGDRGGCSGRVASSKNGPGTWRFPEAGNAGVVLTGASYVRIPQSISAERAGTPMREVQGILALITGGTGWVSESASPNLRQQALSTASFLRSVLLGEGTLNTAGSSESELRKRSEYKRRAAFRKEPGVAFLQPPTRIQWPDLIIVNGTNYTEQSVGSPIYQSSEGAVLTLENIV